MKKSYEKMVQSKSMYKQKRRDVRYANMLSLIMFFLSNLTLMKYIGEHGLEPSVAQYLAAEFIMGFMLLSRLIARYGLIYVAYDIMKSKALGNVFVTVDILLGVLSSLTLIGHLIFGTTQGY